jgi:hypothetical protein
MRKALVLAGAAALMVAFAGSAQADPVQDFIAPPSDPAAYLPSSLGDPWFDPPAGYENLVPGTVLARRDVAVTPEASSVQLLFRSTDSKNRPIAAATTVLTPTAPWTGGGDRPVIAYNEATDSLGNTCAPSYTLPRGNNKEIDQVRILLGRGYTVVMTDYQGPRQAYSAGLVSGHTVLDGLRASRTAGVSADAPIGITGYSGGAIASGWAAQLAPEYAPELNIAGVAFGGPPTDYKILQTSLNGQIGSGLFTAATIGLSREYPEMRQLANDNGKRLALAQKDQCVDVLSYSGHCCWTSEISPTSRTSSRIRSPRPSSRKTAWARRSRTRRCTSTRACRTSSFPKKVPRPCRISGVQQERRYIWKRCPATIHWPRPTAVPVPTIGWRNAWPVCRPRVANV